LADLAAAPVEARRGGTPGSGRKRVTLIAGRCVAGQGMRSVTELSNVRYRDTGDADQGVTEAIECERRIDKQEKRGRAASLMLEQASVLSAAAAAIADGW